MASAPVPTTSLRIPPLPLSRPGRRERSALELRLARLERAASELKRLSQQHAGSGVASAPLRDALHSFTREIAVTRTALRRRSSDTLAA